MAKDVKEKKVLMGDCEDFCPDHEVKLRIKEKLIHFYELKNGQKNIPGRLVKSFSRSAAGLKTPRAKDLRTERCLQRTIEYLLKDILLDKRKSYPFVYDFIFDRLRAVRQEIVMQNYDARKTIKLLEPMIMFLAYSRYRLCGEPLDNFDPKICDQHLQECLKRVLCCYDEVEVVASNELVTLSELRNRYFVEALYQLFNLGSTEALRRAISLPADTRTDVIFASAYNIALSYHQGNLYRVLDGFPNLPHILCAILSLKIQVIRRKLYESFAHAYSSKQQTVPAEFVCRLAKQKNIFDMLDDCKYYNLSVTTSNGKRNIRFSKADFKGELEAPVLRPMHEYFVEEKLKSIYLPEVLLLKKL